ncbi:MAG: hypothetical protein AAF340_04785 [Pseudomonadota bacterium]
MKTRSTTFHIAAAVAFLSATPLVAGGTGTLFLPDLTFPEPIEAPTKSGGGKLDALPNISMPATGQADAGGWIIEIPNTKH